MSTDLTDLPEWVWGLLDAISDYEDEHPLLYRMDELGEDGQWVYERAACFGGFLGERGAWPPRDVMDAASFRRHILRNAPTTTHAEDTEATTTEETDRG